MRGAGKPNVAACPPSCTLVAASRALSLSLVLLDNYVHALVRYRVRPSCLTPLLRNRQNGICRPPHHLILTQELRVKTLKTFVSPNRFAALASDEDLPEVFSPPSVSATSEFQCETTAPVSNHLDDKVTDDSNKPSPPAIVINNVTNYSALKANFISLLGADGFTVTVKGIHVKTRNCTDYYKLTDYCNDQDLEAHTWAPRHIRPIKVFIRHLHHTIAVEDIEKALTDEGFSVLNVSNIHHRVSKQALSLFSVLLTANEFNRSIYQLSFLLNSKIVVEKPNQARFPPQCKQCQRYGHTQGYCNNPPRCVKCSNNHVSKACTKPTNTPAKCALCAGAHTANYTKDKGHRKITPPASPTAPSKVLHVTDLPPLAHTLPNSKQGAKTYAKVTAGNLHNSNTESISVIMSHFVTQLNSLITPLISLLSNLLNTILSKNTSLP
ncbi:hypothetical protein ACI65C_000678 [Semiaphis heraclei]